MRRNLKSGLDWGSNVLSFGAVAGNDKLPPAINLVFKTGWCRIWERLQVCVIF